MAIVISIKKFAKNNPHSYLIKQGKENQERGAKIQP